MIFNKMNTDDTIAAICTAPGGAISIIRISGKKALSISEKIWESKKPLSEYNIRSLNLGNCKTSSGTDTALAVYMQQPATYTGEDVVEIQCHGGTLVTREILESIIKAGARHAEPGEFTYRAFINNKLDLTQAEAVSDIITAHSDMALNVAEKQMSGVLGDKIRYIRNNLVEVLAEAESHLDFPDEELNWVPTEKLNKNIDNAISSIEELLSSFKEGVVLRNGIKIVIAGKPNAGKSSLLNAILGYNRAIVTNIPGTTRDTLEEFATIRNIPVKLIDTAGIREADDIIEGIGVEKSFESLKQAEIILWVMDASANVDEEFETMKEHLKNKKNIIAIWNKIDLTTKTELPSEQAESVLTVKTSILKNDGLEQLFDAVETVVWGGSHTNEPEIAVSARHATLLENALKSIDNINDTLLFEEWELAAVELRQAIFALGSITGEDVDPDVLDDIFSKFCIGK